jgi:uncharacterized protein
VVELDTSSPHRLPRGKCLQLLPRVAVGRVAFSDRALPAIVPVTFRLDGEHVVIRTSAGSRLGRIAPGTVVAFEVDEVEPALQAGWSVVVVGRAEPVEETAERERLTALLDPWVASRDGVVVRIAMTVVEGRQIAPRAGAVRAG